MDLEMLKGDLSKRAAEIRANDEKTEKVMRSKEYVIEYYGLLNGVYDAF